MTDKIIGDCSNILSRDTFELRITRMDEDNQSSYQETERIQISNIPDGMKNLSDDEAKKTLGHGLNGRSVICHVKSKNDSGTLLCDIYYWPEKQKE